MPNIHVFMKKGVLFSDKTAILDPKCGIVDLTPSEGGSLLSKFSNHASTLVIRRRTRANFRGTSGRSRGSTYLRRQNPKVNTLRFYETLALTLTAPIPCICFPTRKMERFFICTPSRMYFTGRMLGSNQGMLYAEDYEHAAAEWYSTFPLTLGPPSSMESLVSIVAIRCMSDDTQQDTVGMGCNRFGTGTAKVRISRCCF